MIKRALENLSPDDRAAREHDKRNHHLALYANSASVPIHVQPSAAVRLRSNADFDIAAGVAVIAVTHGLRWTPFVRQPEPLLKV